MKLLTPQKEIVIRYDQKLSDKEYESLVTAITRKRAEDIDVLITEEDKQSISIKANEIQDAIEVFGICKEFSEKRKFKNTVLLYVEVNVELDEGVESDEFLGKYIRMPEQNEGVSGLSLKFIYDSDKNPLLVLLERNGDSNVEIRIMDILDETYNFIGSYEHSMSAIHKIINF